MGARRRVATVATIEDREEPYHDGGCQSSEPHCRSVAVGASYDRGLTTAVGGGSGPTAGSGGSGCFSAVSNSGSFSLIFEKFFTLVIFLRPLGLF